MSDGSTISHRSNESEPLIHGLIPLCDNFNSARQAQRRLPRETLDNFQLTLTLDSSFGKTNLASPMELTECIRTKIEEMRQKKLARHAAASAATEHLIAQLTVRRSSLFEALENELLEHSVTSHDRDLGSTPEHASYEVVKSKSLWSFDEAYEGPALDAQPVYQSNAHVDALDATNGVGDMEHINPDDDSSVTKAEQINKRHTSASDFRLIKEARVANLREEAAETDVRLQSERAYLQELRALLASSLASIEKLEADLCQHSESWEAREKDRLSIERAPANASTKRKRESDLTTDPETSPHKKAVKTIEAIGWMGLGSGLYYAGKACNLF